VVSCPHDIKGEGIYAFITLKDSALQKEMEITTALQALVKREIAAFAVPDYFLVIIKVYFR
jgi:acetyl-CoA synthetase